jgi:hypothetical protein
MTNMSVKSLRSAASKHHMTSDEVALGIQGYRPSQHIISIEGHPEGPFKLTGAICYDATDIKLIFLFVRGLHS